MSSASSPAWAGRRGGRGGAWTFVHPLSRAEARRRLTVLSIKKDATVRCAGAIAVQRYRARRSARNSCVVSTNQPGVVVATIRLCALLPCAPSTNISSSDRKMVHPSGWAASTRRGAVRGRAALIGRRSPARAGLGRMPRAPTVRAACRRGSRSRTRPRSRRGRVGVGRPPRSGPQSDQPWRLPVTLRFVTECIAWQS